MKFKAADYKDYNNSLGLYRYKDLHYLLDEIFIHAPIDKRYLINETEIKFDGMICYIDTEFGSQCELVNTGYLPLEERIKLHEKKLKQYKKEVIQMKIPFGV